MQKFNVTIHISFLESNKEYNDISSNEVLLLFKKFHWQQIYDDFYVGKVNDSKCVFSVSYLSPEQLEFTYDVELFFENIRNENSIMFSVFFDFQQLVSVKRLFGLLEDKQQINNSSVFMENQNFDFTLKCLEAFLRFNNQYLKEKIHNT